MPLFECHLCSININENDTSLCISCYMTHCEVCFKEKTIVESSPNIDTSKIQCKMCKRNVWKSLCNCVAVIWHSVHDQCICKDCIKDYQGYFHCIGCNKKIETKKWYYEWYVNKKSYLNEEGDELCEDCSC
jgi:hypothetical protein